ncbi:AarF/ABC1/UbiB kinase family protein [Solimonas sp. K1W22B-7]|uniref:ABC1 kinase family protein n=1 Tax=Solimonas sp. K1W22B-7 TaxID=2303331 RepID=UPI000E336271|nr:AarF/ABC1/UbiB kinase family protein [Solimonas sp. K1W22B-7]AXQ30126.1 AarF/ABC1/UbiB kinase family protein [Solimonas sp. K1W22B-7]
MSDDDNHPSGKPAAGAKRFLKMAGMTASLATRYAGHALANGFRTAEQREQARDQLNAKAGEQLAQTLGELKGAVMKLGQIASQAADFLPSEIAEPLKKLQKEAPPMPFAVIRQQIERELKKPLAELFRELDPKPYAAASIGQVHRGVLHDGREVVVKVQYPGVAASCDTDLKQLKFALRSARLVKVGKEVLDELFEEIRTRLHEELDYVQEAQNMALFRDYYADDPLIVVPATVPEFCAKQVMTMVLEPGDHLDTVNTEYDQDLRNELAIRLFHFMCRSLFGLQAVHADPNPGNFAYRRDGSLVIYDFGCIKRLEPDSIAAYRDTVKAALAENWAGVDIGLIRLGARVPGSAPVEGAFYAEWRRIVMRPFISDAPFDFASSTMHKAAAAKGPEVLKRMDQFQPAVKTAYLDRMVGGHYWTLVRLKAQVALAPLLRGYLTA